MRLNQGTGANRVKNDRISLQYAPAYEKPAPLPEEEVPETTTPSTNTDTKKQTSVATNTNTQTAQKPYKYNAFTYDPYAESEAVRQANALLQQHMNNRPGAYQNQWKAQIDDYLNQIENRGDFSYNFNEDALYNQYKDQYIRQGQMAMMDTAGQAAALTGGYGNSYAQNVGQQAYNQHLTQLNNIIPELQQQAYGRYMDEGQRLQDMYNMYMGMENQDYGRYQDDLANWHTQLGYLDDRYNTERQFDYNNWETKLGYDYNNHTTQENMRWEQYLAEQEKNQAAAEMMAAAGNYDRLAQLYGLSADEVKAIQNANAPKYLPAPTGDDVGDGAAYNIPIDEQINCFDKALERGQFDLEYLVNDYAYRYGTDPEYWRNRAGQQPAQGGEPQLSADGQAFMKNLPYAHAGSSSDTWKNLVLDRLEKSNLSDDDKYIIAKQLGL